MTYIRIQNSDKVLKNLVLLNTIPLGGFFIREGTLMRRVYPAGYITNSKVLARVSAENDALVECMSTGKVYALSGKQEVEKVISVNLSFTTKE